MCKRHISVVEGGHMPWGMGVPSFPRHGSRYRDEYRARLDMFYLGFDASSRTALARINCNFPILVAFFSLWTSIVCVFRGSECLSCGSQWAGNRLFQLADLPSSCFACLWFHLVRLPLAILLFPSLW